MHLTLSLPGLIWSHEVTTGQMPKQLQTEVLDEWLRFGNIQTTARRKSDLYATCQSYPSLLNHCKQAIGVPTNQAAFFASPVLQRVDLHSMSISDGSVLGLTKREAVALCRDINTFLEGSGYKFLPYREYLWLVTVPNEPTWQIAPLCDIEGQLKTMPRPSSDNSRETAQLQTLQTELQMLLAAHPINQQRRQNYQPEINGVWFWRDLLAANPQSNSIPLLTDAPLLSGSSKHQTDAPYDWAAAQDWFRDIGKPTEAMLWLNSLEAPTAFADLWGYQDAFNQLNQRFFVPIQQALQQGYLSGLTIQTDGEYGFDLRVQKRNRLAFWKKGGMDFQQYLQDANVQ